MAWTTSYYHYDALGSTRELTDSSQAISDNYVYDAYGDHVSSSGATVNPFRYVGELGYYLDADLKTYYVRARHYDPFNIRWLSPDLIWLDGGTWNLYCYVHVQPTELIDPMGMEGISRKDCEALVDYCAPEFKDILDRIKAKGCEVPQIICRDCAEAEIPGLSKSACAGYASKQNRIFICFNRCFGTPDVSPCHLCEIGRHELIHAEDHCDKPIDKWDCDDAACSEIRAYACSGNCDIGGSHRRRNESQEECVRRAAALSASTTCGGEIGATESVERQLLECMRGCRELRPR